MVINLNIPEFNEDEKRIWRVFSGIEERARIYPDGTVEVKVVQCDSCGKCCMHVGDKWIYGKDPETGWCKMLYKQDGWDGLKCGFHAKRPFTCCSGDMAGQAQCCIRWEKR